MQISFICQRIRTSRHLMTKKKIHSHSPIFYICIVLCMKKKFENTQKKIFKRVFPHFPIHWIFPPSKNLSRLLCVKNFTLANTHRDERKLIESPFKWRLRASGTIFHNFAANDCRNFSAFSTFNFTCYFIYWIRNFWFFSQCKNRRNRKTAQKT